MITDNIAMWRIRRSIDDGWDCSKTQTLLGTSKIRNQLRVEFCVSSSLEVEHSFLQVGCVRISLAQFNWISYFFGRWSLHGWYLPLSISGIRILKYSILPKPTRKETRGETKPTKRHQHQEEETRQPRWGNHSMWITSPQTKNLPTSKSCFTFLKIMKQCSKWLLKAQTRLWDTCPRTHRVALDWLFDRISLDPKFKSKTLTWKKRTRRHVDEKQLNPCWLESYSPFV